MLPFKSAQIDESLIEILVRRFEIFQKPMQLELERTAMIVTSIIMRFFHLIYEYFALQIDL